MHHPIINPRTYLQDLLDYATQHIKRDGNDGEVAITIQELETIFHQPFSPLLELESEQDKELPQIQLCIEVLRQHLGLRPLENAEQEQALAQAESDYWETAYRSLLIYMGTSLNELSEADEETQVRLAQRLGITVERLPELSLDGNQVSDGYLQEVFGLADTNNPIVGELQEPMFLQWRREQIVARAEQLFEAAEEEEQAEWVEEQEQQAAEVLAAIRAKVEGIVLPMLRSALIAATETDARYLGELLQIDCEYAPDFKVSRIWQAISSLQQLMRSMRAGLLKDSQPTLSFEAPDFYEEWRWLGAFDSWKAARSLWLYPENLLAPNLKETQTPIFSEMVGNLRRIRHLKPDAARNFIQEYEVYFKDICRLKIEASCEAELGTNLSGESTLFQFGRSESGRLYYAPTETDGTTFWRRIPGLEGFDISKIIGAAVYQFSETQRLLYVFFQGQVEMHKKPTTLQSVYPGGSSSSYTPLNKVALAYSVIDLQDGNWTDEYEILLQEMPSNVKVRLEQRVDLSRPPRFIFLGGSSGIKYKRFDFEENTWTDRYEDFQVIIPGNSYSDICALLFINGNTHILLKQAAGGRFRIAIFPEGTQNSQNHYYQTVSNDVGEFAGLIFRSSAELWATFLEGNDLIKIQITFGNNENITSSQGEAFLPNCEGIVFHCGTKKDPNAMSGGSEVYYQPRYIVKTNNPANYAYARHGLAAHLVAAITLVPILPTAVDYYELAPNQTQADLTNRIAGIRNVMEANQGSPLHIQTYLWEAFFHIPLCLAIQLRRSRFFGESLDYLRLIYDYTLPVDNKKVFFGLVSEESIIPQFEQAENWYLNPLVPHAIAEERPSAYTKYVLLTLSNIFLENGNMEFSRDTLESVNTAKLLYTSALEVLESPELTQSPGQWANGVEIPANPLARAMQIQAEISLFKIHTGRNIAGDERPVHPPLAASININLLQNSGTNYLTTTTFAPAIRLTAHRYTVLIERAKQLTALAQQMEAAYLSTLEKLEAEELNLLNVKNDMELSKASIRLQDLRVKEVENGVLLAELQQQRTEIQKEHFSSLIADGYIEYELKALDLLGHGSTITSTLQQYGAKISEITGGIAELIPGIGGFLSGSRSREIQKFNTLASYERREQEWIFQEKLSDQDMLIGKQHLQIANDQLRVVGQEWNVAAMRFDHTESVANFLANKFLNAALYEWMSEVLGNIYGFFLQQATSTAQLAALQLSLERQEPIPAIILVDYWDTPETGLSNSGVNDTIDRRGLTGSARLLQDIHKLDQIAFQTDRRKLELKKTISLSVLSPAEFQQFRDTGAFRFYTPIDLFDQDFPGHYLRLIKQVKISVLALASSTNGIHATLTNNGISRIVTRDNQSFIKTEIRRPPESIALTSPLNATGLFELKQDNSKLLPFESTGVDTFWELEMPKAANQFDYRTIADVLLTIEYTALHNNDYRKQVIERLDRTFSSDRAFSFRHELADQWYDLNNPDQTDEAMTVQFETLRSDFPPNLEELRIQQIVLYFAREDGSNFEVPVRHLLFTPAGSDVQLGSVDQNLQSLNGIVSTRSGNIAAWDEFIAGDHIPWGSWELSLADSEELRTQFSDELMENILFVITYEGTTPPWPE